MAEMCGIAGIWSTNGSDPRVGRAELDEAVRRLHHRGPDDRGTWANDTGVALGHTRLSILDLSPLGHQPMASADGRYVVVFNGEIYNFHEIRTKLMALGHGFRGTGDTEVILHAFAEWGIDAVQQFIGMYAIALWDQQAQTLDLLRDRVGVKPLYYGWHDGTLCFASELKALRAFTHWTPQIDRRSLGEFLQYGYIAGDRTIYSGIHKLPPGHHLTLTGGKPPVVRRYWTVLDALATPLTGSDQELEARLEELIISSCRYRMVSDVPVGVYLSGGIDSSLVTAVLARHYDQQLHTFTIGFDTGTHDESRWAKKVAERCGTRHTEYMLGERDALAIAKDWGALFDEPFGDSSGIPTLLVSRLASQDVKVVLSADGGDELFSGYLSHTTVLDRLDRLARMPPWLTGTAAAALAWASPVSLDALLARLSVPAGRRGSLYRRLRGLNEMLRHPTPGGVHDVTMSYLQPADVRRLIGDYDPPRTSADSYPGSAIDQISLWDFHHYLPEDILTKVDRTTMAVSIEGREPLLDHRLAEFAFRLPTHLRRGALGPKHLLRKILYQYVPRELVDRPKQGFAIPLERWLRNELGTLVRDHLSEERTRAAGVLDAVAVQSIVKDFEEGNTHLTTPVWFLLAFEMWRRHWG